MRRLYELARSLLMFCAIEVVARLLYYSGILFLIGFLRQRIGRPRLLVPMYHRISETKAASSDCLLEIQRGVPLDLFKEHLRIFRWFGPLLSLQEGYGQLHDPNRTTRSAIALTFDDGYRDNVTLALPALRAVKAKATIFPVVRTASGGRQLWWDELASIIAKAKINGSGLTDALQDVNGCVPRDAASASRVGPQASRAAMAEYLCERCLELPNSLREGFLNTFAARLGVGASDQVADPPYATWHELQGAATTCEIGGHTCDHMVLTCEDPQTAQTQIADSRTIVHSRIGKPVHSFAYPNGRHDSSIRALTAAAGYRLAVTVQAGVNYPGTDPFELRRVPVHRERPFHLAFKLAFYGWVRR